MARSSLATPRSLVGDALTGIAADAALALA